MDQPLERSEAFDGLTAEETYNLIKVEILDDDAGAAIWDIITIQAYSFDEIFGPSNWLTFIDILVAYCLKFDYDLFGAMQEKLAYNQVRKDHQKEARLAEGGKQF
jgi:hypothetical protein